MVFQYKQPKVIDAMKVTKDAVTPIEQFDAQGIGSEYAKGFFSACFIEDMGLSDER